VDPDSYPELSKDPPKKKNSKKFYAMRAKSSLGRASGFCSSWNSLALVYTVT
jgi:hypothetical protein